MRHLTYVWVLLACLAGALWVEPLLHVNVLRRWRRLAVTILVVVVLFGGWDVAAIAAGHWSYDPARTLGVRLLGRLPIEELLFFIVVPTAAILGFEAVRSVRGARSPAGDEKPAVEPTNVDRSPTARARTYAESGGGGRGADTEQTNIEHAKPGLAVVDDAAAQQTPRGRSWTPGSGP